MMKIAILLTIICQLVNGSIHQYPEYLKAYRCRASNPDYDGCLLKEFKQIVPYYVKGIPELGIAPIDPYVVATYSINASILGLGQFDVDFKDSIVKGLGNIIFHSVKADLKLRTLEISATVPLLEIDTNLNIAGRLLSRSMNLPLKFHGNISDIQVLFKSTAKIVKNDGEEFYKIDKVTTKVSIGDGSIRLDTPNKNVEDIVKTVETVFNENARDAFNMVSPMLLEYAQDFMKNVFGQWLSTLSVSDWVPK